MRQCIHTNVRCHDRGANDNAEAAECIEVFDRDSGWMVHVDFGGVIEVMTPYDAAHFAYDLYINRPHLRGVAMDISASATRARIFKNGGGV